MTDFEFEMFESLARILVIAVCLTFSMEAISERSNVLYGEQKGLTVNAGGRS